MTPPPLVAIPPDMTLGELREAFPAARFVLVYRPDGSIEIRRRNRNGALIMAGSARIVGGRKTHANPPLTTEPHP